jgi:hypothetical protein
MHVERHPNGVRIYQNEELVVSVGVTGNVRFYDDNGEVRCFWGKVEKPFDDITLGEMRGWVERRNKLVRGYCRYLG